MVMMVMMMMMMMMMMSDVVLVNTLVLTIYFEHADAACTDLSTFPATRHDRHFWPTFSDQHFWPTFLTGLFWPTFLTNFFWPTFLTDFFWPNFWPTFLTDFFWPTFFAHSFYFYLLLSPRLLKTNWEEGGGFYQEGKVHSIAGHSRSICFHNPFKKNTIGDGGSTAL